MATPKTTFTVLRTKCQRENQLRALDVHNNRAIPVRGSNPEVKDGVRVLRLKGKNALDAVENRIRAAGARKQKKGRVCGVEIVLTFSPDPDPMPSHELVAERGVGFLDATYGKENIVAI